MFDSKKLFLTAALMTPIVGIVIKTLLASAGFGIFALAAIPLALVTGATIMKYKEDQKEAEKKFLENENNKKKLNKQSEESKVAVNETEKKDNTIDKIEETVSVKPKGPPISGLIYGLVGVFATVLGWLATTSSILALTGPAILGIFALPVILLGVGFYLNSRENEPQNTLDTSTTLQGHENPDKEKVNGASLGRQTEAGSNQNLTSFGSTEKHKVIGKKSAK